MKIVNSAAAAGSAQGAQKSGVVGTVNPFKKVMSGANGTPSKPVQGSIPGSKSAGLTAPPVLKKQALPGGVAPLQGRKTLVRSDVAKQQVTAAGTVRKTARADANAKAENLVDLRAQAQQQVTKRYDTRLIDLICQELKSEFGNELRASNSDRPSPVQAVQQPQANLNPTPIQQAAPMKDEAKVKAASAVELIEKIEAFVKSQRPGLALTLDSSLGVRVEIERLGPKEVALRVVGANGPPAPEDIGRIREEMRARGLKVGALSVA